jgi:uncharacterized protein YjbJ (UPF0337 family)
MKTQEDKIKGKFNSSVGKAKEAMGKAVHDRSLEESGRTQRTKGNAQRAFGAIEETIQKGTHFISDVIEEATAKFAKKRKAKPRR